MRSRWRAVATIAAACKFCVGGAEARADAPVDLIEQILGASNLNAALGNGGLTLGISHEGDVAVLAWPTPSAEDQLLHLGKNGPHARDEGRLALAPTMGIAAGIAFGTGPARRTEWLRDAPWTVTQTQPDPAVPLVETRFVRGGSDGALPGAGGLTVVQTDFVLPASDVWVRHLEVSADSPSGASGPSALAGLDAVLYENLSPSLSEIPQLPLADWAMDAYNDWAAAWDADAKAIVHGRPRGRGDLAQLADLVARPDIDYGGVASAADVLAQGDASEGAWFALGASGIGAGEGTSFQVGFDTTRICDAVGALADNVAALPTLYPGLKLPIDPAVVAILRCDRTPEAVLADLGETAPPTAAFVDAADGTLEGSTFAAGQVDGALMTPLVLHDGHAEATFLLAAGARPTAAKAALAAARAEDYATLRAETEAHWHALMARAHLPQKGSARLREVAERALVNLIVAQDRESGAIVASIARQAPYALDWPRDGAFFNLALSVGGFPELAERHLRFTVSVQRSEAAQAVALINPEPPPDPDDPATKLFPAGGWEMNSYADGTPGGNIRWEIDNAGLTVWSLVDHRQWLTAEAAAAWDQSIWPTVERAAALLARWRDPVTKLQAPANEDDNAGYTQTLHGAVTTWLALDRASALAERLAKPEAAAWRARADELRAAILAHFVDADGLWVEALASADNPGNAPGGASAWAIYPAGLLTPADPHFAAQLDALLSLAADKLDPAKGGGAYVSKMLLAGAMSAPDDATRARVRELLEALTTRCATPDTGIFGEVFVPKDGDFEARVSTPHVWAGVLAYLTAMALEAPERFVGAEPARPAQVSGGCRGGTGVPDASVLWALAVLAGLRRLRRA